MLRKAMTAIVLAGAASVATPAAAQVALVNLGTLTCTVGDLPAATPDPGAKRPIRCTFRGAGDGAEQSYAGSIARIGSERLPDARLVLIWAVRGPSGMEPDPGFLTQTYVGQPVPGGDQQRTEVQLVGQQERSITLHSATATGDPALSTVTVLELELRSVPT